MEKGKRKTKHKKTVILSIIFGLLCGGVGFAGGYFLYQIAKPEEVYTKSESDILAIEERGKKCNSKTDLLKEFKGEEYNLINYAFMKYARKKNTCFLTSGEVINMTGAQHVKATTINTGGRSFNENISFTDEGAIVSINTACRFYDNHDEKVTAYEYNLPNDFVTKKDPTNVYSYNEFITAYGKLPQLLYKVDDTDAYVTNNADDKSIPGIVINGTSIYQITDGAIFDFNLTELEDGNTQIDVELYSDFACYYYSSQIKTNGGLMKYPKFDETLKIQYILDSNLDLVSQFSDEEYVITLGIETGAHALTLVKYFASDEDLVINGKNIKIPEMGELFDLRITSNGDFE